MIEATGKNQGWDPLDQALWDWHRGQPQGPILMHAHSPDGIPIEEAQRISAEVFFTPELPETEALALDLCRGRVLDIGAGTGRHALLLQERGLSVWALDRSPVALQIMEERGIRHLVEADIFQWAGPEFRFDTLLMLMNGLGLVGSLAGLDRFLTLAQDWIQPTGQLLLDSTDLGDPVDELAEVDGSADETDPPARVVQFTPEYQGQRGDPIPWLFVDPETLLQHAQSAGWQGQIIYQDPEGAFLARLTPL
ncbi:class I SAM-dependent methyltransferase [Thermostichus vulcanus]|uniref:Class I SAM-dependent methyltransferase n=1 Tax=Thermostichus vulcanus str. 'Rupite' TaxID=2813851 RepID=A0ABT0C7Z6_THEVL|nr:class I SAM-dependent methyltransferase [Thermostichus vulcanus]MCJ2541864.1 class I SAM-dependent methyltransferase [Thermostichus vulcanus str. 'Rupite']